MGVGAAVAEGGASVVIPAGREGLACHGPGWGAAVEVSPGSAGFVVWQGAAEGRHGNCTGLV